MKVFAIDVSGSFFELFKRKHPKSTNIIEKITEDIRSRATGADPVVFWDTKVDPLVCMPFDILNSIENVNGGGGSLLGPLVEYIETTFSDADEVIIYSDGWWGDFVYKFSNASRYKIVFTGNSIPPPTKYQIEIIGTI